MKDIRGYITTIENGNWKTLGGFKETNGEKVLNLFTAPYTIKTLCALFNKPSSLVLIENLRG